MHEWALAEAVITAARQIAEKENIKEIKEVSIKVGQLQQIEEDILQIAFSQLRPKNFENAKLKIFKAKTTLKCRNCGKVWFFRKSKLTEHTAESIHFVPEVAHAFIKCPICSSPDFEVCSGRGIWLENIKGAQ